MDLSVFFGSFKKFTISGLISVSVLSLSVYATENLVENDDYVEDLSCREVKIKPVENSNKETEYTTVLGIDDLISLALENNCMIEHARLEVDICKLRKNEKLSESVCPHINTNCLFSFSPIQVFKNVIGYLPCCPSRIFAVKAARARLKVSKLEFFTARLELIHEIEKNIYHQLYGREMARVWKDALKGLEDVCMDDDTRIYFYRFENNLHKARNREVEARNVLKYRLCGSEVLEEFTIADQEQESMFWKLEDLDPDKIMTRVCEVYPNYQIGEYLKEELASIYDGELGAWFDPTSGGHIGPATYFKYKEKKLAKRQIELSAKYRHLAIRSQVETLVEKLKIGIEKSQHYWDVMKSAEKHFEKKLKKGQEIVDGNALITAATNLESAASNYYSNLRSMRIARSVLSMLALSDRYALESIETGQKM